MTRMPNGRNRSATNSTRNDDPHKGRLMIHFTLRSAAAMLLPLPAHVGAASGRRKSSQPESSVPSLTRPLE